ncbi:MAG: hypothetical protein IPM11_00180 [Micropruina sp.]|nr:hypothetical protein [Micropruina sp.]
MVPGGEGQLRPAVLEKFTWFGGEPCCAWIRADGKRPNVKIVHNSIHCADMRVHRRGVRTAQGRGGDLRRRLASTPNGTPGGLDNYLIEISSALRRVDRRKRQQTLVGLIVDASGMKNTGVDRPGIDEPGRPDTR